MYPQMPENGANPTPRACIESLMAWWADAGVEGAVAEESVNWLRPRAAAPKVAPHPADATGPAFPERLADFHAWLAASPDLTEARWPGQRVLPAGPEEPALMIVLPAPDPAAAPPPPGEGDRTNAMPALLDPAATRLTERMLAAIGLTPAQCYFASLSLVPPPGRLIAPEAAESLARRMRHHIGLVRPRTVLLAGDQTSRALASTDGMASNESLRLINYPGGKVPASSVIHPRLMMGQPSAKAGAWQALRQLVKGWGQ